MSESKSHAILVTFIAVVLIAVSSARAEDAPATQPAAQTGEFTTTFMQRSSLTQHRLLAHRLAADKETDIGDDYDLAAHPFVVYVPPAPVSTTQPDQKFGIIVFLSQESFNYTPPTLRAEFDQRRLIFITPANSHFQIGQALGLSIDAVFNLEQKYPVDPGRVYLIGTNSWTNYVGLAASDVFMGDVYIWIEGFWANVHLPGGRYVMPNLNPVSSEMIGRAKNRPQVLGFETHNKGELKEQYATGYVRAGFKHVFKEFLPPDEFNYPTMKTEWFDRMMTELESGHPDDARPATMPALTEPPLHPAPMSSAVPPSPKGEAEHLFKMARMFKDGDQPELSRSKLEELLRNYPNDPLAEKARAMLQQMNGN